MKEKNNQCLTDDKVLLHYSAKQKDRRNVTSTGSNIDINNINLETDEGVKQLFRLLGYNMD